MKLQNNEDIDECYLISDRTDQTSTIGIRGKLTHLTHKVFDHFDVTFTNRGHQTRHLSRITAIRIGRIGDQYLRDF